MTISAAASDDEELLAVAATENVSEAEGLLAAGADIDCRGQGDRTPLHVAAQAGQLKMAQLLLKKGASGEIFDDAGDTPLHLAARGGHYGVVDLFIQRGFDVELANVKTGETPLMAASHDRGLEAMAELFSAGADVDAADTSGETALMKAAKANQPGAVEKLIKAYADIFTPSNNNKTAFDLALEAQAGAACVALYPHVEANECATTYDIAQKMRPKEKIKVGKPLKFKTPGGA